MPRTRKPEPTEPDIPQIDDDVLANLSDEEASAALDAIAEVKAETQSRGKVDDLAKALASLTVEEFHALLQKNAALGAIFGAQIERQAQAQLTQAGPLPPGTIVGTGLQQIKVPWSKAKIEETYGTTTFVPTERRVITVNGVSFTLKPNEENTVPSIVADVYFQALQERGNADRWANWYFNQGGSGFQGTWTPGFEAPPRGDGE